MKIPVKIVTGDNQATGGLADAKMLKPFASEVVRVPDDLAASLVCGGLLPMTQAEYDKLGLGGGNVIDNLLMEDGTNLLAEDSTLLVLE